ncbi:MAG: Rne/Rng family ribonuclease [Bryobacteraceae bacterium]|jgi:ribonuclease G
MSKELIVSANRHETRVAVLEEDQVVEIFYQRENEYSLAGSIHKGRVTRVLPGMQSAFVDIGLERDAFLYVSDFFEDNDEYDKIVTSVEEKILKLDRPAPPPVTIVASLVASPVVSPVVNPLAEPEQTAALQSPPEAALPGVATSAGAAVGAPAHGRREERGDRGDRDQRGRRGRRRRGHKGGGGVPSGGRGGLPDSKYYSPRAEGEARPEPREEPPQIQPVTVRSAPVEPDVDAAGEFLVLPGESLAKHRRGSEQPAHTAAVSGADPLVGDPEPAFQPEDQPPVTANMPVREQARPEPVVESLAEIAAEPPEEPQPELAEAVEEVIEEEAEEEAEAEAEEEAEEAAAAAEAAALEIENEAAGIEAADQLEVALEAAGEGETEKPAAEEGEAATDEEGPEPARIPTSLTATLREQGSRYPHRVSRRSRRGGRDGRGQAPEPGQRRPPQQEGRQVEGRAERPEPAERPDRGPERGMERTPERSMERNPERAERPERTEARTVPSISDLLKEGQEIIVQIAKEPLGQKGARITSHIALPGRFLVYMPTVDHIGVSRKIPSEEERSRLKRVLQTHRTGIPGGYIVRTAGDGRTEEELRVDMMFLYNLWLDMRQKAERRPAPLLVHHDLNVVERILRDQLTSQFKNIWVDNEEFYESVLGFVQRFQPALVGRVKMYTRSNPIFDEFGITAELEKALRPKVWLKSGGHIVINQTEALVAIDINTGKFVGRSNRLEDTIVKTNTDAVKEIVRQIRLRDLGGIIVVDFIDMDERKNRQKVMQALEEAMRSDRAPYKILQFNDFGLVAITRKRVKQSLERTLCMPCPYCEGAGYVKSPQTVVGEILIEAHKIARAVEGKDVLLRVAPEVAKLLKSNQNSYLQEMEEILGRTVIVKSDPLLHQEKFDLA